MAGLTREQRAEKLKRQQEQSVLTAQQEVGNNGATPVLQDKPPQGIPDQKPNAAISAKPTKPWERAHTGNKPWKRDILALTKKDRDFHCRWVNNENIEARIDRGYEIANPDRWGSPTDRVIDDASPLGRRIVRRGMTLMEIPMEGKKFFEDQNEATVKARKRDAKEMVKKQAEEMLKKAGYAIQIVDKGKVERDGVLVSES